MVTDANLGASKHIQNEDIKKMVKADTSPQDGGYM